MITNHELVIGEHPLTIEDVVTVARNKDIKVSLAEKTKEAILKSHKVVADIVAEEKVVYGITTGFGSFKDKFIGSAKVKELQKNLIRSHSIGTGEHFSEEVVRAGILVRLNSLSKGNSGVRLELIESLISLLNHHVHPYIPAKGSVGCSGDLAPLSHLTLVMMGEGEVIKDGQRAPSLSVLTENNIKPLELDAKEGLAMNNGTAFMAGLACLNIIDAEVIAKSYDLVFSLTLESLSGTLAAFEERVHKLRPHPGQVACAANVRSILGDSKIIASYDKDRQVQDSYSLRCAAQVHGACRDAITHARRVLEIEVDSTTDNPLIFNEDNTAVSAGHFHGQPIAFAMDFLSMAVSELANISERRSAKMVDSNNSEGLPAYLINPDRAGLNNGYMIAQYTAAALVAENKVLANPVSTDSIPTSANQEDHVSFGTTASRQCQEIINNVFDVLSIEAMIAAQAVEFRGVENMATCTRFIYAKIRSKVKNLENDRVLYTDLQDMKPEFRLGNILAEYEDKFGSLA